MVLDLDSATEERIQRQLNGRSYSAPADVIKRALDLLETDEQDRIARHASIVARLKESHAQAERGETFSPDEVRARLASLGASFVSA
jgi:Arc/MetJ-type ribon-helix-helix transcriptional regulator